jgi:hypothetical protein
MTDQSKITISFGRLFVGIFLGPKFKPSFALFGCCRLHPKYIVHGHVPANGAEVGEMLFEFASL